MCLPLNIDLPVFFADAMEQRKKHEKELLKYIHDNYCVSILALLNHSERECTHAKFECRY